MRAITWVGLVVLGACSHPSSPVPNLASQPVVVSDQRSAEPNRAPLACDDPRLVPGTEWTERAKGTVTFLGAKGKEDAMPWLGETTVTKKILALRGNSVEKAHVRFVDQNYVVTDTDTSPLSSSHEMLFLYRTERQTIPNIPSILVDGLLNYRGYADNTLPLETKALSIRSNGVVSRPSGTRRAFTVHVSLNDTSMGGALYAAQHVTQLEGEGTLYFAENQDILMEATFNGSTTQYTRAGRGCGKSQMEPCPITDIRRGKTTLQYSVECAR